MQDTGTLAERLSRISVSATMRVASEADRMRRQGIDVVDFGAGEPDFPTPDNISSVEPETYLYYVKLKPSQPSKNEWVPFNEDTVELVREDFQRLWKTGFLDDLRIEADDYVFSNGVVGKVISYHAEERARIRLIQYETEILDRSKIDDKLKEVGIDLHSDGFLDQAVVARVSKVLRDLLGLKEDSSGPPSGREGRTTP
jgi:hypothetical protein